MELIDTWNINRYLCKVCAAQSKNYNSDLLIVKHLFLIICPMNSYVFYYNIEKSSLNAISIYLLLLQDQEDIHVHRFKRGWKLEALNPLATDQICPATVVKVLDSRYFVVEIDSLTEESYPIRFSCHARSRFIFPCGWCKRNNIAVTPPKGKYTCI